MQQEDTHPTYQEVEHPSSLLDFLVTVAENIKLLLIVPFAVAMSVYAASHFVTESFYSVAVVKGDRQIAALAMSPNVLDAVAENTGLKKSLGAEKARATLQFRLKASVAAKEKIVTITSESDTAQAAQLTAVALLKELQQQGAPKESDRILLTSMLEGAKRRVFLAEQAVVKMNLTVETFKDRTTLGLGYSELLNIVAIAQSEAHAAETLLQGFNESQIVQEPTLPLTATKPEKKKLALVSGLLAGFFLLLFVLIKEGVNRASMNPTVATKLLRIKNALTFNRKLSVQKSIVK